MTRMDQKGFGALQMLLILIVVLAVGVSGWYVLNARKKTDSPSSPTDEKITSFQDCVDAGYPVMESYPEQCSADGQTFTNDEQQVNNGYNTTVSSGLGGFMVTFPDGFGPIEKPLDSDAFYLMGLQQPEIAVGKEVVINELEAFGTDAPSLLVMVLLNDGQFEQPVGTVTDYTLVNGKENEVKGKKYTYIYDADQPDSEGIGQKRYKNDRDYTYIFPLGTGKSLYVGYHVYSVDPSNKVETIEAIIDTIRLK